VKFVLLSLLTAAAMIAAEPQKFQGVITDTMCGAKHTMMEGHSDAECVKMCAQASGGYALYDGKDVWQLSNQKLAAQFPAQKVIVTGSADTSSKTIKVVSIAAAK